MRLTNGTTDVSLARAQNLPQRANLIPFLPPALSCFPVLPSSLFPTAPPLPDLRHLPFPVVLPLSSLCPLSFPLTSASPLRPRLRPRWTSPLASRAGPLRFWATGSRAEWPGGAAGQGGKGQRSAATVVGRPGPGARDAPAPGGPRRAGNTVEVRASPRAAELHSRESDITNLVLVRKGNSERRGPRAEPTRVKDISLSPQSHTGRPPSSRASLDGPWTPGA